MEQRIVTWQQYGKHTTPKDTWVLVDGEVYNVSDYLVEHPGGDDILVKQIYCEFRNSGIDATQKFNQAGHSQYAKSLRNARHVGKIQSKQCPQGYLEKLQESKAIAQKKKLQAAKKRRVYRDNIPKKEVCLHNTAEDCWIIIDKKVYDVTEYLNDHPGGVGKIMEWAGKDASKPFQDTGHSLDAIKKRNQLIIGSSASQTPLIVLMLGIMTLIVAGFLYRQYV